ncbi:hypothetical protein CLOM_g21498 [Closterium sp. NIES-68]|nr:hypothetical protein CLOM_g21498 [Closterium sp. NIES-68]
MRRLRRSSLNCPPTWAPAAVAAAAVAAVSRQRMVRRERRRGQHAAVLALAWCLAALAASPLATMVNAVPFEASQGERQGRERKAGGENASTPGAPRPRAPAACSFVAVSSL